jgi:hypothetical protein
LSPTRPRRALAPAVLSALVALLLTAAPALAAKQKAIPGLPLAASPVSTYIGDNHGTVKLVVRPIKRARLGPVQVALRNSKGSLFAQAKIASPSEEATVTSLKLKKKLQPGTYRVWMTGKKKNGGKLLSAKRKITFVRGGGEGPAIPASGALVQPVTVDWYDGKWGGRDTAGFVAPGIGYGEVVCNPETQWVRFFGSNGGRETAMMTWTYKNWGTYQEKSLQEAVYTTGTGFDFNEGLNKFSPAEKTSTGTFDGVISDRGPISNPGGVVALSPVTTMSLNWEWDFTRPREARCHVEAVFATETELSTFPLARSLQLVWHGEANAAANGFRSIEFPGLGTVSIRCEPGEPRQLRVEAAGGGTITTREASEDSSLTERAGPVTANLPNNGQLLVELAGGQRILVASRWKLNDPDGSQNFCAIAGQVLSPNFPGSDL